MQLSEELARLFTLLTRATADQQRAATLTRLEYLVLGRLEREGVLRAGDLAVLEGLDQSTLSRRLGVLVERGLIEREADPDDRRASLLRITEAGRTVHAQEQARRVQLVTDAVADWSSPDTDELARLLHELNNALQRRSAR